MRRRNKAIKGNDLLSEDVKYNGNYDIETIATYITYNDMVFY